ncbi:MAG: heparinase II/III-family protein [Clostridium sp.]|nr:heparinase II/III-family protein [Clostridium sp.]
MRVTPVYLSCIAIALSVTSFCLPTVTRAAGGMKHPRVEATDAQRTLILQSMQTDERVARVIEGLRHRVDQYADREAHYLSSRLYMNWKTRATDVYIKGETFSHTGGDTAPVPTVMFGGTRSHATAYARPSIDLRIPYADERQGVLMHNRHAEGNPLQWVDIAKTGTQIHSGNVDIMAVAKDAAFLWWLTGEEKYGALAADVFDTYLTGLYHRNLPVDLNHGHQQTLVGMTSFEVIHEDIVGQLTPCYDFLYNYLLLHRSDKMTLYADAFRKLADTIIRNGVPHNNWDIIQARFIFDIALILEPDTAYADRRGSDYYLNAVVNDSTLRQWSLKTLARYGFDDATGIWSECPGYSVNVVNDFLLFALDFDRRLNRDLIAEIPVLTQAASALPQYCFPNRKIVGFGDTHPHFLRTDLFEHLIRNARQHGKRDQEQRFTALLRCLDPAWGTEHTVRLSDRPDYRNLFIGDTFLPDTTGRPGRMEEYVSPTFYAPNVSWLVQRNGMDAQHSLMFSLNGSEGNHQHANGISVELYGKGTVLAPDAGIGQSLYSGLDYLEYYSQFPSHNTVCVDGVSSYPVMKSNHAFRLLHAYPAPTTAERRHLLSPDYARGISYAQVAFREPETQADQQRLLSMVDTEDGNGYYVDIFRSRKAEGGDRMHDWFYHNLGQELEVTASDGTSLNFVPTEELSFAGAHLYAYSYIYAQQRVETECDIRARFTIHPADSTGDLYMTLWQQGMPRRTIYRALSPETEGLSRDKSMPYPIKGSPTLTYIARQHGEAWTHPFVTVFEPSSQTEAGSISSVEFFHPDGRTDNGVGIKVNGKTGRTDFHLAQTGERTQLCYADIRTTAEYTVVTRNHTSGSIRCFMGDGTFLQTDEVCIRSEQPATVTLYRRNGAWEYTSTRPCRIKIGGKSFRCPEVETPQPLLSK